VERVTDTIPRFFIFSSNHFAWESAEKKQISMQRKFLFCVQECGICGGANTTRRLFGFECLT
jgi:hypothetical protein